MDKLYEIGLHEAISPNEGGNFQVLRVPGGWVYTFYSENGAGGYYVSSCFVPFNNEFQKR